MINRPESPGQHPPRVTNANAAMQRRDARAALREIGFRKHRIFPGVPGCRICAMVRAMSRDFEPNSPGGQDAK
jgi:hypothetical protein